MRETAANPSEYIPLIFNVLEQDYNNDVALATRKEIKYGGQFTGKSSAPTKFW